MSRPADVALDPVAPDNVEDEVGGAAHLLYQPTALLRPILRLDLVSLELEAGDDLAAVAARDPEPRLAGLHEDDVDAAQGQMEGGGQVSEAPAHDAHLRPLSSVQGRAIGGGRRGLGPERRRGQAPDHGWRGHVLASRSRGTLAITVVASVTRGRGPR